MQKKMANIEAIYRKNPENKGLVMFIHGFMGSPTQFTDLIKAAYEQGYSVAAPVLPGHGGTVKEFAASTYEQWQNLTDSKTERYSHDYDRIYLVGHSMGGLLAVNTSLIIDKVCGIMMIASPFINTKTTLYTLKIRIKQVFSNKNNPIKKAYLENSGLPISPSVIWSTAAPSREVKKAIKIARKNLPRIKVPVTAVFSTADELISMQSLDILKEELTDAPLTEVVLTESLHAYYTDPEQETIKEYLLKALDECVKQ